MIGSNYTLSHRSIYRAHLVDDTSATDPHSSRYYTIVYQHTRDEQGAIRQPHLSVCCGFTTQLNI